MNAFLWSTSGVLMLALLLCIIIRALDELLGVRLRLPELCAAPAAPRGDSWPWYAAFAGSLLALWLGAFCSYALLSGGSGTFAGFAATLYHRLTEAGDAPHYIFIAENGYVSSGENVNNIVFFPLYPLLMRLLGGLLGGDVASAGMILSQLCYAASSVVLLKLAERETAHPEFVLAAYWLYPFGFFCLGVFTEGLFLLLSLSALYCLREEKWLAAGVLSFLCALTRMQGVLLLLPGVYCVWRTWRKKGFDARFLALLGAPLAFFVYLCLNRIVCGSFLAFNYYQSIAPWYQSIQWLGDTVVQQLEMARSYPGIADWVYWPQLFLYYIAALLLLAGFYKKLDNAWIVYGAAYLGMCYTAGWLISGSRYMLGCVPLFLCLGRVESRAVRLSTVLVGLPLYFLYFMYFLQGQCIM